jgi:signal transduction histidine kinase/CheY-like chemotaxis protein/HPt (histidine-containing phosphotransfer) domain-containing protein
MADNNIIFSTEDSKLENDIHIDSYLWIEKEKARLQNIQDYDIGELKIDDEGLLCIARLAANICNTPCGAVDIVKSEMIDIIAKFGFEGTSVERKPSICTVTIEQDDVYIVEDTLVDRRFDENEYVKAVENKLRFYAGHPLRTKEGYNIGVVCVFDTKPKKLDDNQKDALKTLSKQVVNFFELKRQIKSLIAANALAEKLRKSKDEFFNNISHELRTPLNAINGYAEILSKCQLTDEQMEAIITIKNSSEYLISLINDILDFSKLKSGKLSLEYLPFNLYETVKLVYDLLLKKAEQKGLNFLFHYDKKIPAKIIGDKVRINQIIMNLVGNAIKFTGKGSVTIQISLFEENPTNITMQFSIQDTGIGIEEEKLSSIFNRYEQAEGGTTFRKYGGTGLGLNISKNLVELQGGKLNVKSKLGVGSEFYFQLKFDLPTNPIINQEVTKSIDYNLLKKLKILVCEDNNINIKLFEKILKSMVSEVAFAENGQIAIDILKNKSFDVILMDIHMPIMDGLKTTEYIRYNLKLDTPIIGHTANANISERDLCLEKGMNDYFLKSFIPQDIYEIISKNFLEHENTMCNRHKIENTVNSRKRRSKSYDCATPDDINKKIVFRKSKSKSDLVTQPFQENKETKNKSLYFIQTQSKELSGNDQSENITENSSSPRFDHVNIKTLEEYSGGDKEFKQEFIKLFLENFYQDIKSLEADVEAENMSQVNFWVHKMKSPLMMLGLFRLKDQLEKIKSLSLNSNSFEVICKLKEETKNFVKNMDYVYNELNEILIQLKKP